MKLTVTKWTVILIAVLMMNGCFRFEPTGRRAEDTPGRPAETGSQQQVLQPSGPGRSILLPAIDCRHVAKSVRHAFLSGRPEKQWERTVNFPARGRFVEESHYVTSSDKFSGGRLFADRDDEKINVHLQRSLQLYRRHDPTATLESLYGKPWQKVWTPAEGGAIGQGSVGDIQAAELSPEMEMWLVTMMWAAGEKPARGTRLLLKANGKMVVVIAGFETGPGSSEFLGGVTPEVHQWLGTTSQDKIEVLWLEDQTAPPGPVVCTG